MSKPTNVLELNGLKYDTTTGRLLGAAPQSIDGFLPSRPHHAAAHHTSRQTVPAEPVVREHHRPAVSIAPRMNPTTTAMDIHRGPVRHAKPHQMQHSQTLMRQAVHRPGNSLKRSTKVIPHTSSLVKPVRFDIVPKHSAMVVDEGRLHRARTIARSQLIRRFAMQEPVHRPGPSYQPRQTPAPVHRASTALQAHHDDSMDIFERALAAASNPRPHTVEKRKTTKAHRLRQVTSVAASFMAIILIVAFVAYQNATMIQLRLASSRAGINATLPAWQPSGFKLGTFAYGPGSVTIKYENASSGQEFTISQAASNWDSAALLSDFVYPNNSTYDTVNTNGNTIYMYGGNNATWVSGGIWYKLTTNSNLSTPQIVNIATSMQG